MQAIAIPRFGAAEVLQRLQLSAPTAGPREVAIDVAYAGANFAEVLFRRGIADVPLPFVPGIEVAGTIRQVGPDVVDLRTGQRVAALTIVRGGGYGEVAVTRAELVVPLDELGDAIPLHIAAAVPANTTSAFLVLEAVARLQAGERVAVHAAAGGVGSQIGQVARLLGAGEVIGVVGSEAKAEVARAYGYDQVVLRADWVKWAASGDFDVVVDQVGGPQRHANLQALSPLGRLIVMGNASGAEDVRLSSNELWLTNRAAAGFNLQALAAVDPARVGQSLRRALDEVAAQRIVVDVETLPLDAAAEAHRRIESGATTGKLVLDLERSP
jgi:NADPH:quinone reductase